MKMIQYRSLTKIKLLIIGVVFFGISTVTGQEAPRKSTSEFWSHVQFGGGLGVSIGNAYTNIALSPGAIYNFNDYVALGIGLQSSYVKVNGDAFGNHYKSWIYGGSLIAIGNPIEQIQLSAELEQVRVNSTLDVTGASDFQDNFWNTALFLGAGYRVENVTIGARYNVLYNSDQRVYYQPFMPFVRVYF